MLTVDQCMALRPCPDYPRERVESLWAGRDALTAEDVAALAIPAMDRLWCLLRMAPRSVWLPAIYAAADRAIRASSGALRDAGLANESARLEHLPPIVGRRSASAASYAASAASYAASYAAGTARAARAASNASSASDAASYAAGTARAARAASNASSASDAASYAAGTARAARAASNASDARDAASFAASYAARAASYASNASDARDAASFASDAASYAARDADAADLETTVAHVARLIGRQ